MIIDWFERYQTAKSSDATSEQLDELLDDVNPLIRYWASINPNADPESLAYYKMKYVVGIVDIL